MSFRDHVVQINQEVTDHMYTAFNAFFDGIEWVAPFVPWIVTGAMILGFILGWFRVFG